ncbi:Glycosyl transferase family 11 [Lacunisphaera limnophila]|uniref:Glycosyl transferase family 11 n=1 Tax=Lacunisphaera limnophila TaxID=1838286 RepID=A0A1D8AXZ2_9BACT|nr:alpha-1,2-fucosyltransferase [Lacunisphaera limnophila]AOS45750.1 Glycosyl transferase family 11 [Lacunisphaera limnophila]
MIRVRLKGRLGNHLFQVATALALADRHRTSVVVDPCDLPEVTSDLVFTRLPVLQLDFPRHLASVAGNLLWQRVAGRTTGAILHRRTFRESSPAFDPAVLALPGDVWLDGFFQDERYFRPLAASLREWFGPARWLDRASLPQLRYILDQPAVVGLHVRRTDFLVHPVFNVCGQDYYTRAIRLMRERVPGARFAIFSDDPEWCSEHFAALDPLLVDNRGQPYAMLTDLALLSACHHQIIANSSFSWWGAWLNAHPGRQVLAPDRWSVDGSIPIETKFMAGMTTVATQAT